MERHGTGYRDNFSQASSSEASSFRSSATGHNNEDYGIFFQETSYPVTAPTFLTPRVGLQNIDLNIQADSLPHLASYSEFLESDRGQGEPRLPPLPPRSGHGSFQPPRQGGGGRGPSRGGCQAARGQGRRPNSLNTRGAAALMPQGSPPPAQFNPLVVGGGGRGTLMPIRPGRASSSASAGNSFPPQDLSAHNQWEQADDNGSHLEQNEDEEEDALIQQYVLRCHKRRRNIAALGAIFGWPGSVHDMRVFNDAIGKYGDKFSHPPQGKFYLVDLGYPNRPGYLAPYRGTKYHLPEYREGPMPRGKKELFNFAHSSLRNVIERSFGVLKMKWRILLNLLSYPMEKQSLIIMACMALHNYIKDSALADEEFDMCDRDKNLHANG